MGLTRHPTLWFDDGSIIIYTHSVMFQVHMSMLSRRSTSWKISLPRHMHSPEAFSEDGKPFIEFNDRPDDLAHLLEAIYNER